LFIGVDEHLQAGGAEEVQLGQVEHDLRKAIPAQFIENPL
jgi:hypothetical protein